MGAEGVGQWFLANTREYLAFAFPACILLSSQISALIVSLKKKRISKKIVNQIVRDIHGKQPFQTPSLCLTPASGLLSPLGI